MEMAINNNSNHPEKMMSSSNVIGKDDLQPQSNANDCIREEELSNGPSKKRWSKEENILLLNVYAIHGAKWKTLSEFFNDRSPFSVKNHFYALSRKMSHQKRNELKLQRIQNKEQKSIQIFCEFSSNLPTRAEEDLIVESFLADDLKSPDKMELDEKWPSHNLNTEYANYKGHEEIQQILLEKLEELKNLSSIIEKQLLCKWAAIKAIPKTVY